MSRRYHVSKGRCVLVCLLGVSASADAGRSRRDAFDIRCETTAAKPVVTADTDVKLYAMAPRCATSSV